MQGRNNFKIFFILMLLGGSLVFFIFNPKTSANNQKSEYKVLKAKSDDFKCSYDIELKQEMTKTDLKAIANQVRSREPNKCSKFFIVYYLPNMIRGSGGWATSHFNPNLEVKILGLTIDQEENISKKITSDNLIGSWVDNRPYVGSITTLEKSEGIYTMVTLFNDGGSSEYNMVQKQYDQGTGYTNAKTSEFGEYFIINNQGNLDLYDSDGFIVTFQKK